MKTRNFALPIMEDDEDDESYGNRAAVVVISQLEEMLAEKEESIEQDLHETLLCEQLVAFANQQDSHISYSILSDATQLAQKLGKEANLIIQKAYTNEKFVRTPFMKNPTFACINDEIKRSSKRAAEFLSNPVWMLGWVERANAEEISQTIRYRFVPRTQYWALMSDHRNEEIRAYRSGKGLPGCATIFFSLIDNKELTNDDMVYLIAAFNNPQVSKLPRVLASAKARIKLSATLIPDIEDRKKYTMETIRAANGCFINSPFLTLTRADFSKLELNGAVFNRSTLIETNFQSCGCSCARFDDCTLSGSDFSGSDLTAASFIRSKLTKVSFANSVLTKTNFANAEISGVDFSEVKDFTGADFSGCALKEKLNTFIKRSALRMDMDNIALTFENLLNKINGHEFMGELRGAIANDLIDYCTACLKLENVSPRNDPILPADKAFDILCLAYFHPLFNDQRNYKLVVDAANTVVYLGTKAYSLFSSAAGLNRTKENNEIPFTRLQIETDAQLKIYPALLQLLPVKTAQKDTGQIPLATLERRPPPPSHSPYSVSK